MSTTASLIRATTAAASLALVGCADGAVVEAEEIAAAADVPVEHAAGVPFAMTLYYGERSWNVDTVVRIVHDPLGVGTRDLSYFTGLVAQFERSFDRASVSLREGEDGEEAVFAVYDPFGSIIGVTARAGRGATCAAYREGGKVCRLPFSFVEGSAYRLRIWELQNRWWGAWVIDEAGTEHKIGEIRAPADVGRLDGQFKIITDYTGNDIECGDLPRASSRFFGVSSNGRTSFADRDIHVTGIGCDAGTSANDYATMSTTHVIGD